MECFKKESLKKKKKSPDQVQIPKLFKKLAFDIRFF